MTAKSKAWIAITLLFVPCVVHVQASCTVCVMLNLVSTPYKCPPCSEPGESDDPSNTNNTDNGFSSKSSCEKQPHDWTTCFVAAKKCDKTYKYRSLDGSCNNLKHPTWGMASTAMVRIRPAWYADGKHKMIKSANDYTRPLPRVITSALFGQDDVPDNLSLAAMVWGQPPTHDGAIALPKSQSTPYCCSRKMQKNQDLCMPIKIPKNDAFYSKHNVRCISEIRTNTTYTGSCNTDGPVDQINGNSALIDLNIVYGPDDSLRTFKNGQLTVQVEKAYGKYSFPPNDNVSENCFLGSSSEPCYIAGDVRVNQNTEHTIIQVGLLRLHNLIAGRFAELNPDWDEETVYQEARTVNIAIFQHITFNEWLPNFVGSKYMEQYKLSSLKEGFTKYNPCLPFMTTNDFTTSAFRVFHSAIQGYLRMSNNYTSIYDYQPIGRWMVRPVIIQEDNHLDKFLIGMLTQPMLKIDEHYNDQVRNNMFEGFDTYGQDLVGLDIQRGRDHGLDSYINYLEIFTGNKATKWDDLYAVISKENVDKLKNLYGDVRNIDAIVGMILENKVPGTRLGPTSLRIILDQFVRWKFGDRFWFEHGGLRHSFTSEQLGEIRNITFSKFVCLMSNNITRVPRRGFDLPSKKNPIVECNELPGLDFSKWKK